MANYNPIKLYRNRLARKRLSPPGKKEFRSLSKAEQEQFYTLTKEQQRQFSFFAEVIESNSVDRVMQAVNELPRHLGETMSVYHELAEKAKRDHDLAKANMKSLLSGISLPQVQLTVIERVNWRKELETGIQKRIEQRSYRQETPLTLEERKQAKAQALALIEQKRNRDQNRSR